MRSPTRLNFVLTGFLLAAAFACQTPPSQPTAPPVVITATQGAATTVNPNPADAVVPPNGESVNCSGALSPRLRVGETGRVTVTNGQPVRVREQPDLSANIIARIPEGTAFTVMDGPVCADGWYWWKINTGNTGWASEGSPEGGYFLEPYQLANVGPTAAVVVATATASAGSAAAGQVPTSKPPAIVPTSTKIPQDVVAQITWDPGAIQGCQGDVQLVYLADISALRESESPYHDAGRQGTYGFEYHWFACHLESLAGQTVTSTIFLPDGTRVQRDFQLVNPGDLIDWLSLPGEPLGKYTLQLETPIGTYQESFSIDAPRGPLIRAICPAFHNVLPGGANVILVGFGANEKVEVRRYKMGGPLGQDWNFVSTQIVVVNSSGVGYMAMNLAQGEYIVALGQNRVITTQVGGNPISVSTYDQIMECR